MKRFTLMAMVAVLLMAFASIAMAVECSSPKVASFDFLVDVSGSMMMKHKTEKMMKFDMAQQALHRVNDRIPMLNYTGSIHTAAKTMETLPQQAYNREAFRAGINKILPKQAVPFEKAANIPATYEVFNRLTPLGDGIAHWSNALYSRMPAPAAVILVSDGENNRGQDALAAAQAALAANPRLVFHVISVADTDAGQKVLDSIVALNKGGVSVKAREIICSDDAADKFVREVFCAGGKLVLRSVQFALNSADINKQSGAILDEVASIIKQGKTNVTVDGHTCSLGSDAYNQNLSERRAASVKAYLAKKGVPSSSIATQGYGESRPKFDNSTDEGRRLNRRAEIDFR